MGSSITVALAAVLIVGMPEENRPTLDELIDRVAAIAEEKPLRVDHQSTEKQETTDPLRANHDSGIAGNANFTVVATPGNHLAREVLEQAEKLRSEIALQWLGEELPDGVAFTVIQVKQSDTRDVGRLVLADGKRQKRNWLWLETSHERALGSTLAHEMTHIVLSTRFDNEMPVWANEGIASLRDDTERMNLREKTLSRFARSNRWPSVHSVMTMPSIHPQDGTGYTIAVSLTEFLLERRDQTTFLEFLDSGRKLGWSRALNRHYQIESTGELQSAWERWVRRSHDL